MSSLSKKLAVHRITFLRPREKGLLEAAIAGGLDLASLSFSRLEGLVGRLLRGRVWNPASLVAAAEEDLRFLERTGIRFVSWDDPEYPPLLRETEDAPYGIFIRGARLKNEVPSLAIVGTRSATGRGLSVAWEFGKRASCAGLPVVSGLARGIDAAAHRGALGACVRDEGSAPTVAVLPVGIDGVYPPSHRRLAESIVERGGSLISEYPPGVGAARWRFPERNRIIAGMARATLVVEAPTGSGALITAGQALEGGRDVFVALSLLGGPQSGGIDRLAEEGALPLASLDELLLDWGFSTERGESRSRDPGLVTPPGRPGDEAGLLASSLRAELGLDYE